MLGSACCKVPAQSGGGQQHANVEYGHWIILADLPTRAAMTRGAGGAVKARGEPEGRGLGSTREIIEVRYRRPIPFLVRWIDMRNEHALPPDSLMRVL